MSRSLPSLSDQFAFSGLVVAALGFFLTRFTVTLAVDNTLFRFLLTGGIPLVLGLSLSVFGVALAIGDFGRQFVRTVTVWCVVGAGTMLVLVGVTLLGSGAGSGAMPIQSQTYLSNFLIGGSVGGTLTGIYAARSNQRRRELQREANRLELINRLLRDEVLNAVTVIRGRTEVARMREADGSLQTIRQRADDVELTVENVKHIARQRSETQTLESTAVANCVESAVDSVRTRYPDANYEIDIDVAEDTTVRANRLLEDVVAHLVENAVAYTDEPDPRVAVTVTSDSETVTISVADDGPGLPDRQQRLIERGEVAAYDDRSTGFGLNLLRLLSDAYDGSVTATVADGTSISLTLPRPDTASDGSAETAYGVPKRALLLAVGASLVAGVVMGIPLQLLAGDVPVIGALYGAESLLAGWLTHEFHSVVFGLVYAGLVTLVPERYGDGVRYYGVGLAWATVLWLVAASLVMPIWLRLVGIPAALPDLRAILFVGHLVWGLSLAALYRYSRSLTG